MRKTRSSSGRGGFTLVELVVGIAMFALLALALQSTILLATRAIPNSKGLNASTLAGASAIDRMNAEVCHALTVTELTPTAVTFTVADRNSDGADETIRYAWSGVSGASLTRQYNGGTAVSVLDDVRSFSLSYDKRSVKQPTTYTEQPEQLLFSGSGLLGSSYVITSSSWVGEGFTVNWPSNAVRWRVTRVRFEATKDSGSTGICRVQVRTTDSSGLPTTKVIDQATLLESSLNSSYAWQEFAFSRPAILTPTDNGCIVFRWASDSQACDILQQSLSLTTLAGARLVQTTNGGSSWSGNVLAIVPMVVYGAYSTKDADAYQYFLTNVRATLRAGADGGATMTAGTRVLAEPQVTGP
jgi:prepilin-type N-terminal cleavage/methylation domain-containing protein